MKQITNVSLDHFGAALTGVINGLMRQDGSKRERRSMQKTLTDFAVRTKSIPKEAQVSHVGITVDNAGQIELAFVWAAKIDKPVTCIHDVEIVKPCKECANLAREREEIKLEKRIDSNG